MVLILMVYCTLVSIMLAGACRALEEGSRMLRMPVRVIWFVGLLATVGLVLTAPLRSGEAEQSPAGVATLAEQPTIEGDLAVGLIPAAGTVSDARLSLPEQMQRRLWGVALLARGRTSGFLGWAWLAFSIGALTAGTLTMLRYQKLRRIWRRVDLDGGPVWVALDAGPAVLGVVRPEIVIPEWLLGRPAEERRLVLLHEREHVRGRDTLVLAIGWVLAALIPWNPAVWWMLLRLRLAVELDCDARVLKGGVHPRVYGSMLIDLSTGRDPLPIGMPALVGFPSNLERRLLAMTMRVSGVDLARGVGLAGVAILAVLAACEARLPTGADINVMDVAAGEAGARQLGRSDEPMWAGYGRTADTRPVFVVNGAPASTEEFARIRAASVESIRILKGRHATAFSDSPRALHGVVLLTLKPGVTTTEAMRGDGPAVASGEGPIPVIMTDLRVPTQAAGASGVGPLPVISVEIPSPTQ